MERETSPRMDVLIAGGGIAGLTVAFLLEQEGYNTTIVERASAWKPAGGGITLMLNGMKMLNEIGVGKQVEAKGQTIKQVKITDAQDHLLSCLNVEQYATTVAKTVTIHRNDLHEILRNKLTSTPVYFNTTISSIEEQTEKVKIVFSDGRVCYYDLVVGCDGIHSDIRKVLFKGTQLKYAGYTCWRFVCNMDDFSYEEDTLTEMWGEGKRFGIVPLTDKRVHCFASINTSKPEKLKTFSVEHFKSLFSGFKGIVPQILHTLNNSEKLIFNRLEDVYVKNWANGRIVLIGDAAHGMTPNLTQGASMAIEDAICLCNSLKEKINIWQGLQEFFNLRKKRVWSIQRKSAILGKVGQWQSPLLTSIRNFCWKNMPDKWLVKDFENLLIRKFYNLR